MYSMINNNKIFHSSTIICIQHVLKRIIMKIICSCLLYTVRVIIRTNFCCSVAIEYLQTYNKYTYFISLFFPCNQQMLLDVHICMWKWGMGPKEVSRWRERVINVHVVYTQQFNKKTSYVSQNNVCKVVMNWLDVQWIL